MVEITASHEAMVGATTVRRALPRAGRRTVGAWCFADHMGPVAVRPGHGLDVGPHPHIGLHTATWLIAGSLLHRDSLGTEQEITAGQLNLMTAGHGIAHAEEAHRAYEGPLQGIQLWIAQPEATRHGPPAFEHHGDLPHVGFDAAEAIVFMGSLAGASSPARADTPLVGADLTLRGNATVPVDPDFEHALVVLEGELVVDGEVLAPGHLGHLGLGRDHLDLAVSSTGGPNEARAVLLGGEPFPEPLHMWWNFVARTRAEVIDAYASWSDDDGRFGTVDSDLPRVETTPPGVAR